MEGWDHLRDGGSERKEDDEVGSLARWYWRLERASDGRLDYLRNVAAEGQIAEGRMASHACSREHALARTASPSLAFGCAERRADLPDFLNQPVLTIYDCAGVLCPRRDRHERYGWRGSLRVAVRFMGYP